MKKDWMNDIPSCCPKDQHKQSPPASLWKMGNSQLNMPKSTAFSPTMRGRQAGVTSIS